MTDAARRFAAARGVAKLGAALIRNPVEPVAGTRGTRMEPATGSTLDTQKTADFRQFLGAGTPGTRGTPEINRGLWENCVCEPLTDHDAPEAAAMAEHYAAPAGPTLPRDDPLRRGLLAGYRRYVTTQNTQKGPQQ